VTPPRLAGLAFARHDTRAIDDGMELRGSARRSPTERQLDVLLTRLQPGDTLLVSDLSRMGRSVGAILTRIDPLVKPHIPGGASTAGLRLEGRGDTATLVTTSFPPVGNEADCLPRREHLAAPTITCAQIVHRRGLVR
jgi:hypothetical protein